MTDARCCCHCGDTQERLDEIAVGLAEMRAEFSVVKKVVYGAAGAVGLSFIGALAAMAWQVFGL